MRFIITPTYREVFSGEPPTFSELLAGIPTKTILGVGSVINAELFLNLGKPEAQQRIFNFLLQRQKPTEKLKILQKLVAISENSKLDGIALFSTHLTLEFLHSCLMHYCEDENFIDTNPDQEMAIFKAYLLVSEQVNSKTQLTNDTSNPLDYYRRNTWPTHINQLEVNHPINYLTSMVKSKCFFDFLEFESGFDKYVTTFLTDREFKNSWSYIFNLAQIVQNSTTNISTDKLAPFYIKISDNSLEWFEELCLDPKNYHQQFKTGKRNNDGFKDKPLVHFQENSYFVIDWNLFANKIYSGLIYDFFSKSGIKNHTDFETKPKPFIAFKKYIAEFSIEKYLFKKLVEGIFKGKHTVIKLDDNATQGFPDAYVRIGKRIFIFEVKDAFFPSDAVESYDFELIRLKLDEKYNSRKKGTGQILKHIQRLQTEPFEDNSYSDLKLKTRNIVIYPILIFTDTFFSTPGFSLYLQEKFDEKIHENKLANAFEDIKPLSFININFLIDNLDLLQQKDFSLDKVVNYVNKQLNQRKKNHEKQRTTEALLALNEPFESIATGLVNRVSRKSRNYVLTIFKELNLNRGME